MVQRLIFVARPLYIHTTQLVKNVPSYIEPKYTWFFHRSPSLSQMNPVHTLTFYFTKIQSIVFPHLHRSLRSGPFRFPNWILYTFFISPMDVTCLTHLTVLDMVTLIISCEEYNLWSSLLCSFAHPPGASSLSGPKFLSTLISFPQASSTYILSQSHQIVFLRFNSIQFI
jgi:hypothetical protein